MTKHQVDVAGESLVASLLSQTGYEVFVQYGANQPGYDLVAIRGQRILRVSVKGTQFKGWIVSAKLKKGRTNAQAADDWSSSQGPDLVFAYVQFYRVNIGQMAKVYLARAREVAAHIKAGKRGIGDTTLRWNHTWQSGVARGTTDTPPADWLFSQERIDSV